MALTQVTGPYPIFTDLDGTPLDDGYLYIGAINQDPEQNPIQVFWDSNLTIPATQPIRTSNGYAYRNGTPALLYTAGAFSITIRNKREEFVLYSPVGYGFDPAAVSASVVKNDFIGDGVEVDFVLSAAPSTILATNVFINGVYQEKDSYTLSGNTITFSVAPPLSSSIEVMTNETGVINSGNATAISYTLTEPGAVAQTVQTKLDQYVSVKDFGAVGDGVTNDSAAFQAALDTLGNNGGEVYVPFGSYVVSNIALRSYTHLNCAHGTTLIPAANSLPVIKIDASGSTTLGDTSNPALTRNRIKISGCVIDNRTAVKTGVIGIDFIGVNTFSLSDFHILEDIEIWNCERGMRVSGRQIWATYKDINIFGGTYGYESTATSSFNANTFINFRVRSSANTGVKIVYSQTLLFMGCNFESNNTSSTAGLAGIELQDADNPTLLNCYLENNGDGVPADNVNYANNSFGLKLGGSYINNLVVQGCYIVGSGIGLYGSLTTVNGGGVSSNRFNTSSTTAIYIDANAGGIGAAPAISPFVINSDNSFDVYTATYLVFPPDGNGRIPVAFVQSSRDYWLPNGGTIDLVRSNQVSVFPDAAPINLTTFINRLPGMALTVYNADNANNVTIDAANMASGVALTITPLTAKTVKCAGFPTFKFIEV